MPTPPGAQRGTVGGAGVHYAPIPSTIMDARLRAADKPGEHLWIMTAAWTIADPATARDPEVIKMMDRENLVLFAGPGCFKCERPYSGKMAKRRCLGRLDP
jgi:hypothetical protein